MPAKRKGKRKNRRIKFSELNYVEKNYMRKGKAVIPVKLDKIDDLYFNNTNSSRVLLHNKPTTNKLREFRRSRKNCKRQF